MEPEIYDYTSNNWSYCNSNEKLKEKFEKYTRKTFDRFTTKRQLNLEHHTYYGKYCLKLERWRSPIVKEKYQEEKDCDKRQQQQ